MSDLVEKPALNSALSQNPPSRLVAARMTLSVQRVTTCQLSNVDSGDVSSDFVFKPLTTAGTGHPQEQALGEIISLEAKRTAIGAPLVLTLTPFEKTELNPGRRSRLITINDGVDVYLVNYAHEEREYGRCDNEAARDFELYFDLLAEPPRLFDRVVPQHKKGSNPGSAPDCGFDTERFLKAGTRLLVAKDGGGIVTGSGRPICPMVSFP
jgi:hypothetical protein